MFTHIANPRASVVTNQLDQHGCNRYIPVPCCQVKRRITGFILYLGICTIGKKFQCQGQISMRSSKVQRMAP